MSVFSVNQTRHLYVAKNLVTNAEPTEVGDIKVGHDATNEHIYFKYMGAGSNPVRTDMIPVKNILYQKVTTADKMAKALKRVKITNISNDTLVAGQDYMITAKIRQHIGMSDKETYLKHGFARYDNITFVKSASDLYKELAASFILNNLKEVYPLFTVYLTAGDDETEVTANNLVTSNIDAGRKTLNVNGTYDGIIIEEYPQDWELGIMAQVPVYFDITANKVRKDGQEINWAVVEDITYDEDLQPVKSLSNGKEIADLEYFLMGERGDLYRGIGWPKTVKTTYMIGDGDKADKAYDLYDIHYAFTDGGMNNQMSEKTITIAVATDANTSAAAIKAAVDGVISPAAPATPSAEDQDDD